MRNRLEPAWRFDVYAQARLDVASLWLWQVANQAYLQWTRHLNHDPGSQALQVGSLGSLTCHGRALACYNPASGSVILSDSWFAGIYSRFFRSGATQDLGAYRQVYEELFWVLTHEVGHQFGYRNPGGTTDGCGGAIRCHAAYGSGSVVSYDTLRGGSSRYYVTEEDIRHVPNATWNADADYYIVKKEGDSSSIDDWGVGILHRFEVGGQTAPGRSSGGNLSIIDTISGHGFFYGWPSENVSLTTTATWSGEDNFLGVNFNPDLLGPCSGRTRTCATRSATVQT